MKRLESWLSLRLGVLAISVGVLALAMVPSVALAGTGRPFEGSIDTPATQTNNRALAVDQANGDVYAIVDDTVTRFDAAGAPKNFTAGPNAGTSTLTGFNFKALGSVAVDNSGGPLDGTVYVADSSNAEVKAFDRTGASLGTIKGTKTPEKSFKGLSFAPRDVSVDQESGDLYIGTTFSIWRYSPTAPVAPLDDADYTLTGINVVAATRIAAHAGKVYMVDRDKPFFELVRFVASDFATVPTTPKGVEVTKAAIAVSVDPGTGEVYVTKGSRVSVFDSTDTFLYEFGAGAYFSSAARGIAVKSTPAEPASRVYIADTHAGGNEIDLFGPAEILPNVNYPAIATFGSDGTSGTSFPSLSQLAFQQAGNRLYALAESPAGVFGFDASNPPIYSPLPGFSPLTVPAPSGSQGMAVDNTSLPSSGNVYVASGVSNQLYGFDSTGTPLAGFPVDPSVSPGAPDGSPVKLCDPAVDSAGNVWVANSSTKRILKYSSGGASLAGTIDTSAQGSPCRLAFDTNDDLYVGMGTSVWKFTAASNYAAATKIEPTGENAIDIAVNPVTHHLYVAQQGSATLGEGTNQIQSWVDEYDAAGNFVEEFAVRLSGSIYSGVAVDGDNGFIYIADSLSDAVEVLGPGTVFTEVSIGKAVVNSNTSVTVSGSVNPQGASLTDCRFEYVTEAAFAVSGFEDLGSGGSAECDPSADEIPADTQTHAVSGAIGGLTANSEYRVRLVAANNTGESTSSSVAFVTSGPPEAETVGAPIRSTTTAQLGGRVNPRGAATTYLFEYGTEGPCDSNSCVQTKAKSAGSGDTIRLISEEITGLEPGTTYHYRVAADNGNADGPSFGEDMVVTTRADEASLSHGHLPGPPGSDRAYEQVNAPDTGGNPIEAAAAISDDGTRAVWGLGGGTPFSETGSFNQFYSVRTPQGWQVEEVYPVREELPGTNWGVPLGSSDLSIFAAFNFSNLGGGMAAFRITPGAPPVKLHEVSSEDFALLVAGSDDASTVLIEMNGAPDPEYPGASQSNLYDVGSGVPRLVNVLPGPTVPACGVWSPDSGNPYGLPANNLDRTNRWISADGDRVFFPSKGDNCDGPAQLYVRDLSEPAAELISGPQVSGPLCGGGFIKSTPEAVFFWSKSRLVAEDNAPSECADEESDGDVYRYDLGDGTTSCITCVVAGLDADVAVGSAIAAASARIAVAEDGSRAYFVSSNRLVPGAQTPGIYRVNVQSGDLDYVAHVDTIADFNADVVSLGNALSPDGSVLILRSDDSSLNPLGGSQNGETGQYYRYDDEDRSLVCVSCPRDGGPPRGPVPDAFNGGASPNSTPLSADGDTFAFATTTALLPSDQNTAGTGQNAGKGGDIYEWRDGRLLLVTDGLKTWTGEGSAPRVRGITPSGQDILFTAPAQYTADALDDYLRLYDARIGGGFEFPEPPSPCSLEVCQGTPKGAPAETVPGTGVLAGAGNPTRATALRCAKGKRKVRRGGKTRCVKRARGKRQRSSNQRRAAR